MGNTTLQDILVHNGLHFDSAVIDRLEEFYKLVLKENEIQNLTTITAREDFYIKHILDSIIISKFFDFDRSLQVIDVGSGAGFPGMPLAICHENVHITLLEARAKRTRFLEDSVKVLGLDNVTVVCGRAEDVGRSSIRECFDLAVIRAVSSLPIICEYCLPFVKEGGVFMAYKSDEVDKEIDSCSNALNLLGGNITDIHRFHFTGTDIDRSLVEIHKISTTPEKYPRRNGVPEKKPL